MSDLDRAAGTESATEMGDTIPAVLRAVVERTPDALAVVDGTTELTFAELASHVDTAGRALLAHGIQPGDRAAIWAPNSVGWIIASLAISEVGATLIPLNTRYAGIEAREILRRTKTKVLFVAEDFLDLDFVRMLVDSHEYDTHAQDGGEPQSLIRGLGDLLAIVALAPALNEGADHVHCDVAIRGWSSFLADGDSVEPAALDERARAVTGDIISDIVFTSGTTGQSKGVLTTHAQTTSCAATWAECAGILPSDRYLIASPFSHTFGFKAGLVVCLMRGAAAFPLPVFNVDEAIRLLTEEGITVVPGPPTILQTLASRLSAAKTSTQWRVAVTGSATVPVTLVEQLQDEIRLDTVLTAYGLTEAVVVSMCRPEDPADVVARSAGRPVAGFEVRIRDREGVLCERGAEGEIEVRGPNLMVGYLDDPEATAEVIDAEGWFRTGDIGTLDENGFLSITDRIKNMFTVGGFNVYPAEVENAIARLAGVVECAVIGVTDERLGSVGLAVVVADADTNLSEQAVIDHCAERLANYKVPRSVVFLDVLPRSSAGKVVIQDLEKIAQEILHEMEH